MELNPVHATAAIGWKLGVPLQGAPNTKGQRFWQEHVSERDPELAYRINIFIDVLKKDFLLAICEEMQIENKDRLHREKLELWKSFIREFKVWAKKGGAQSVLIALILENSLTEKEKGRDRKIKAFRWKLGIPADNDECSQG